MGLRCFLVALAPARDLLFRAKDLFIAAIVVGVHPLRTDARATSGGICPTPLGAAQGYPSRIKLGVPKISKIKKSRGSEELILLCSPKPHRHLPTAGHLYESEMGAGAHGSTLCRNDQLFINNFECS